MLLLIILACSNSSDAEPKQKKAVPVVSTGDTAVDTFVEPTEPTGDTGAEPVLPRYEEYPCQHPGLSEGYFVPWAMAIGGSFTYDRDSESLSGNSAYLSVYFAEEAFFEAGEPQHLRRLYIEFDRGGVNSVTELQVDPGWYAFEFPTGTEHHTTVMDDLTEDLPPEWGDAYALFSEHVPGLAVIPMDPEVGYVVDEHLAPPDVRRSWVLLQW